MEKMVLPKNFCQIGEKEDRIKIYLEDYVHAYLCRCRQGPEELQAGVLLGLHEEREGVPCLFICGAVGTDKVQFEDGRLFFREETWRDIGRQMREYFPDMGICGWYVYEKNGMSVDRLSLKRTYEQMFADGDKVLLLAAGESEDFYILRNGNMLKMLGYYIYYETNDAMQAYLTRRRRRPPVDVSPRPDAAIAFRKKMEEKDSIPVQPERESSLNQWMKTACTTAAVLVLAWILGSGSGFWQQRGRAAEETGDAVSVAATVPQGDFPSYEVLTAAVENPAGNEGQAMGDVAASGEVAAEAAISSGEAATEDVAETSGSQEARETAEAAVSITDRYRVKTGETLALICKARYGNLDRLDEICELNHISDPNYIAAGQEILLPVE